MHNYNEILSEELPSVDVLAQSVPNANLQEFEVIYTFWKDKLPIRTMTIPVFFDDLREDGIRTSLIADKQEEDQVIIAESSMDALQLTTQENVGKKLNTWLESQSETWARRPELRAYIMSSLFFMRNAVFNISPQTVRRKRPVVYEKNMQALVRLPAWECGSSCTFHRFALI